MLLPTVLALLLPLSLTFWLISVFNSSDEITQLTSPLRWLLSTAVPVLMGISGYRKKSLDLSGLIVGIVLGFILTLSNYAFTVSLLVFFITSSMATKFKAEKKRRLEADFKEGGQRNWVQVICNGGVAAQLALLYLMENGSGETPINFTNYYNISWFAVSVLGAVCCANGDTWASELAPVVSNSKPYLITSLKRVPIGTNGGVTLIGLLVSALGGFVVSFGFLFMIVICANTKAYDLSPPQWPILIVGLFSGFFGSLVDSLLGAHFQYSGFDKKINKVVETPGPNVRHISGVRLLDNHSVNLLSTLITALVSPYFAIHLWSYF